MTIKSLTGSFQNAEYLMQQQQERLRKRPFPQQQKNLNVYWKTIKYPENKADKAMKEGQVAS